MGYRDGMTPRFARARVLAAALAGSVVASCASAPPTLPPPSWVPPPQSAACSQAAPCQNVRKWLDVEKQAAEAWSTCHPAPTKLNQAACAKADAAYARVHKEQLDYFGGLCGGSVGSDWFAVAPYVGTPESDRIATCGGKGGSGAFTCRVLEWTWATESKGGAFVVFLAPPEGAAAGVWAVNSCAYCETGSTCRDVPPRP